MGKYLLIAFLVIAPIVTNAAGVDYDLGIRVEDIVISPTPSSLVAGQTARIYATVHNFGEKDAKGQVAFFQGPYSLGEPQPVSVRARGFADEIFMDFTVPAGSFNILAKLQSVSALGNPGVTTSSDQNPSNDETVTPLMTAVPDSDGDGIADSLDNCSMIANVNQTDTDGDKTGDACDPDMDNDGLSNIDEKARGTDPRNPDTDGDGIIDSKDSRPLTSDISPLTKIEVPHVIGKASHAESNSAPIVSVISHSPPPQSSPIKGEEAKLNSPPDGGGARGGGSRVSALIGGDSKDASTEVITVAPPASKVKIPPGSASKLWTAAGLSALFAGMFSFLALKMKTPRE